MYNDRWIAIATRYGELAHSPSIHLHELLAVGANRMTTISIPLSKTGKKYIGQFRTIISIEDADLEQFNWSVSHNTHTQYAQRSETVNGKRYLVKMHRVILARKLGRELLSTELPDHIDGNGLNNTRPNLRLATNSQNLVNRGKSIRNKSGYKGVSLQDGRWRARIRLNGNMKHIGYFDTKEQAYEAYCQAVDKYHGEYGNKG